MDFILAAEQTAAAFSGPAFAVTNFMVHPLSVTHKRYTVLCAPI
jgi:hypothetical protein